ncbi:MAG: Rne/Rng family ribonuclease [Candidatus Kapabacteria bacterium]|nr:Rne/Rng family ribonuclease [Candidatus Kapabacteria bacterium]
MKKEIIINSNINEVRIAITEDGKLAEYFIELPDKEKYIGNLYYGRVTNVVQGISAAFVNIGQKHDAFLHFSDVDESLENTVLVEDDDDEIDESSETKPSSKNNNNPKLTFSTKRSGDVQINIEQGQELVVQVTREAYGNKGVKVTSKVSIPGRYVVLMPYEKVIGVSKKIQSYPERKKLRQLARKYLPEGFGCIIRTASQGRPDEELTKDYESLMAKWKVIEENINNSTPPSLVYQDMNLSSSIIRDLFTKDVVRVSVDSYRLFLEIRSYLQNNSPALMDKVFHYSSSKPIYEHFGLDREIANTHKRKVFLRSGASIVIDSTEAMTVIDVNSGRAVEKDQENTAFVINLEALREIANQLRLRDYGGIIVIDFIDMQLESNRKRLYNEMRKETFRDRAKTVIFPLTQLGLMQITRQRIHQNIAEKITVECPSCHGVGRVAEKGMILSKIEKWLKRFRSESKEFKLKLVVNPELAIYLTEGEVTKLQKLMLKYFVQIKLQQSDRLEKNKIQFYSIKHQKDITADYL